MKFLLPFFLVSVLINVLFSLESAAQLRYDDWKETPQNLLVEKLEVWRIDLRSKMDQETEEQETLIRIDTIIQVDTTWSDNGLIVSVDTSMSFQDLVRLPVRKNRPFYGDTVLLTVNHYNDRGLIDSSRGYHSHIDLPNYQIKRFKYDPKGRITQLVSFNRDSSRYNSQNFLFDDHNRKVTSVYADRDSDVWFSGFWNYDRKSRIRSVGRLTKNGDTLMVSVYDHLPGRRVVVSSSGPVVDSPNYYTVKHLDIRDNEISSEIYLDTDTLDDRPNMEDDVFLQGHYRSFDKHGQMKEDIWLVDPDKRLREHWIYHYNKDGDLTKVEDMHDGKAVTRQLISYSTRGLMSEILFFTTDGQQDVKHMFRYGEK